MHRFSLLSWISSCLFPETGHEEIIIWTLMKALFWSTFPDDRAVPDEYLKNSPSILWVSSDLPIHKSTSADNSSAVAGTTLQGGGNTFFCVHWILLPAGPLYQIIATQNLPISGCDDPVLWLLYMDTFIWAAGSALCHSVSLVLWKLPAGSSLFPAEPVNCLCISRRAAPQTQTAQIPTCWSRAGLLRDAHDPDRCSLCSACGLDPFSPSTNTISTSGLAFSPAQNWLYQPLATGDTGSAKGSRDTPRKPVLNFIRGLNLLPKTPRRVWVPRVS